MKTRSIIFFVAFTCVCMLPSFSFAQTAQSLTKEINAIIAQYPRVSFNGAITDLSNDTSIYKKNSTTPSHPASVTKLLTAATALATLGSDHVFRTSLYSANAPTNNKIEGSIVLYGRGDPTLNIDSLDAFASDLQRRGVKEITGDIIADESYLNGSPIPPGRNAADLQASYGAQVSALSVNQNTVSIKITPAKSVGSRPTLSATPATGYISFINNAKTGTKKSRSTFNIKRGAQNNIFTVSGSIPVSFGSQSYSFAINNPALYTGTLFKQILASYGITVKGSVRVNNIPRPLPTYELAHNDSLPLSEIVRLMNKHSYNLHAELLLRVVGKYNQKISSSQAADDVLGIAAVRTYVESFSKQTDTFKMIDGSGLGIGAQATPELFIDLFTHINHTQYKEVLLNSLPIAGVDGTITRRFSNTPAQGIVRAKTGTLSTVDTLSGVVTTASGNTLAFSFFATHPKNSFQGLVLLNKITTALAVYAQSN